MAIGFSSSSSSLCSADRLGVLDFVAELPAVAVALIPHRYLLSRTHDRGSAVVRRVDFLAAGSADTLVLLLSASGALWPLAITALGVKLVMDTIRPGTPLYPGARSWGAPGGSNLFAIMGETKRSINEHPFRGGSLTAFMGGCHLDLRQATIPPGEEAAIEVFAMMGGLEIWVPAAGVTARSCRSWERGRQRLLRHEARRSGTRSPPGRAVFSSWGSEINTRCRFQWPHSSTARPRRGRPAIGGLFGLDRTVEARP